MRAVNLLPKDASGGRSLFTAKNAPIVAGVGVGLVSALGLSAGYLTTSAKLTDAKFRLADAQAQLAALPKPEADEGPVAPQLAAAKSARVAAVSTALAGRVMWDRLLSELSQVLPGDVWLTSLNLTAADPTSASTTGTSSTTAPTGFDLQGTTYSHDSVARFLSRLALVPELADVQLVNSTRSPGARTVTFEMTATLKASPNAVAPPAAIPAPTTTDSSSGATASGSGGTQ
ncbi:MAG TPA: PilN domain-containing protein [Gaiellaceae bacterium]|jgi:Tfp pilus assembly protein PilN